MGIYSKIVNREELAGIRANHSSVALCSGCFDVVQSGHAVFFEQCKEFADTLVVAVGRDRVIRRLKGPERPINPENNRAYLVAAMADVDFVVLGGEDILPGKIDFADIMRELKPDVFVLNDDDGAMEEKRALCRSEGVELETVQRIVPDFLRPTSSTEIVKKIRDARK